MHIQQAVINQKLAQELFSHVAEVLKGLPLTKPLFGHAPDLETRINTSCLSYINRLQTRRELFKDAEQVSSDVDSAAQCAMMALNSLPELQPHLEGNVRFYGELSTILKGRFTECALKRLT
jgi:hypothetical protein